MRPAVHRPRESTRKPFFLMAALLGSALAARAEEDPLLGSIKGIQCVGCTAGSVDLIIHDPIDVRDFQIRINETDYQKIVSPLPGKTVYDKNGCFYWFEAIKGSGAGKEGPGKDKGPGKTGVTQAGKAVSADSAKADTDSAVPPPAAVIQGKPSRCIPYSRVEPPPSRPGQKKD